MPTLASCPLSASNSAESLPSGAARSRSASSTARLVLGMKKAWVSANRMTIATKPQLMKKLPVP
jgi:hypothetical protein